MINKVPRSKPVEAVKKDFKPVFKKERSAPKGDVFIGNKLFMNYVTGVVMQFNMGNANEVIVKARGKYISKAVDVVEVVRNRFIQDAVIKDIKIGSDEFKGQNDRNIRVSTIDIVLSRKK